MNRKPLSVTPALPKEEKSEDLLLETLQAFRAWAAGIQEYADAYLELHAVGENNKRLHAKFQAALDAAKVKT